MNLLLDRQSSIGGFGERGNYMILSIRNSTACTTRQLCFCFRHHCFAWVESIATGGINCDNCKEKKAIVAQVKEPNSLICFLDVYGR